MIDLAAAPSLADALTTAASRWPDATCLIEADRDREAARLTYRDFASAGLRLAGLLQSLGFRADDRAAIVLPNQSKWPTSAYAVFLAGGVLVPLDPKLSPSELGGLLAHARPRALIVDYYIWESLQPETRASVGIVLVVDSPGGVELHSAHAWDERSDREAIRAARTRSDLACIVYSSGTGGRTKGCMLTHDNYLEQCAALSAVHRMEPGERYLSILPSNHAIDFMAGFIGPFVCGATVVHLRTVRPEFVRQAFSKYEITHVTVVPMILENLETTIRGQIDALPPAKKRLFSFAIALNRLLTRDRQRLHVSRRLLKPIHDRFGGRLRAVFVGGAFTPPERLRFFHDLGLPVANGYGLTEACTVVSVNDPSAPRADTVGRVLPGVEVRIQDADQNGIGRIVVRGRTVMAGYLDDPELTAETIVDGWLITGDVGRLDASAHLQLSGRTGNMIVTAGGKNVYPEDIESAFAALAARDFCIMAASYVWRDSGQAGERLVAIVRTGDNDPATIDRLRHLNRQLPEYKRVDGYLRWTEDFPRTTSLKIRRDRLAERIRGANTPEDITPL